MKYNLFLTNTFIKRYEKLPYRIQCRAKESLEVNFHAINKKKEKELKIMIEGNIDKRIIVGIDGFYFLGRIVNQEWQENVAKKNYRIILLGRRIKNYV